jgi:SET domain-containing protein
MFLVRTRLAPSDIEGFGVFAEEDIEEGTTVWVFRPPIDAAFTPEEAAAADPVMRELLDRYAYLHNRTNRYIYCGDNARFVNHSDDPNTVAIYPDGEEEGRDVAIRPIAKGEEITGNYYEWDLRAEKKLGARVPFSPEAPR